MSEQQICNTCGRVGGGSVRLCSPRDTLNMITCEYCGKEKTDARHVCRAKFSHIDYICDSCGRLAVSEDMLCAPKSIDKE